MLGCPILYSTCVQSGPGRYRATIREFNDADKEMKHHDQPGPTVTDPADAKKVFKMLMGPRPTKDNSRTPV